MKTTTDKREILRFLKELSRRYDEPDYTPARVGIVLQPQVFQAVPDDYTEPP